MPKTESLTDFYRQKMIPVPGNLQQDIGHFNVFSMENCMVNGRPTMSYSRRDFYKISLIRGKNLYHYADRTIITEGNTLMFFNPQVPYAWEGLSDDKSGFFCIFRESFLTDIGRHPLRDLPMFTAAGMPSYNLDRALVTQATALFNKMLVEINSDYRYKYDLLRNYLMELVHIALKMEPSEKLYQHHDAKSRITAVFTELLERQFPIETPMQQFRLRSASDFAAELSVHVNHLNRAVRDTTGKTTTTHISQRIASEAKALLRHTNWNVAEISYSLGFEEPSHFNNFFKKHTNMTPTVFRTV